jgi:glucose/arabinose dehydrogenase
MRLSYCLRPYLFLLALVAPALVASAQTATNFAPVTMKLAYPELTVQRPVWLCEAPDGSGRIFLVEQGGKILILPRERTGKEASVFLDITDRKPYASNEEGLLALAFHPQFKSNGKFYIFYTQQNPRRNRLCELQVDKSDKNRADLSTERLLLEVPKPYPNHNGSTLLFGPDGYLYFSAGDGGSGNDPHNNGQSLKTWLGKIHRIDVDSRTGDLPYGIPKDNPFVGKGEGVREEIWAYGLRNVWRMSFDRQTGELWAGDVGQNKFEEVDIIEKGGNYGWRIREGFHAFATNDPPATVKLIDPVFEYDRKLGNSMTGGFVYRGKRLPSLVGTYLCADFTTGRIFAVKRENGKVIQSGVLFSQPKGLIPLRNIASFGEDARGELYILVFEGAANGRIYELVQEP